MKQSTKYGLLITTLTAVTGILVRQIVNKGGVQPAMHDLKAGGTKAVEAVKDSPPVQAAAKVIGRIYRRPSNDDAAVDEAELGNTPQNLGAAGEQTSDELKTGTRD